MSRVVSIGHEEHRPCDQCEHDGRCKVIYVATDSGRAAILALCALCWEELLEAPQGSVLAMSRLQENSAGCAMIVVVFAIAVACMFVYHECTERLHDKDPIGQESPS